MDKSSPVVCFSVLPGVVSNTAIYNLLNFPAGVVPVSTVTAEDEEELKHYKGNYQDIFDGFFKEVRKINQRELEYRDWKT